MSLKEIARNCGTSVATVSRVLNQPDYRCADPALQERIWEMAEKLRYMPNTAARQLKNGKTDAAAGDTYTVDVLLTRFQSLEDDCFFKELYGILREELLAQRCHMGALLSLTDMLARSRHLESQSRLAQNPDGLILLGKCPPDLLPFLKKQYAHIIGIDRNPTGFDYDEVFCDGQRAAETVMEYLISLGHKRIAYIGDCSYEARYIGYHQSLLAHKLPLNYAMVYQTGQTRREGSLATRRILEETVRPTAIFCANDSTALGVLDELKAGRRKKYRPSVISIDNIREAQECTPLLTTMDIPKREMAHYAVLVLLDRIRGGHREHVRIELPGKLIVRESCGYCAE